MKLGPKASKQLRRLALDWKEGEHVLVSGGTGSGKTLLTRYLDQIRLHAGGRVIVFVGKLQQDETIKEHYNANQGWVRWKTWPKHVPKDAKRVLFWPDVEGKTSSEALVIMKREFQKALDAVFKTGDWTVHLDEGLFMSHPSYMGFANEIGMMFQMMRSAKGTLIMLVQRPSHIPLTVYANIDYALVSQAPNDSDLKRLSELGGGQNIHELRKLIKDNEKHDFTLIRARGNSPPQKINLMQ